jgi:hypothetical protein
MVMYVRLPTNPDGTQMNFKQRSAARRAADAERRAAEKHEAPTRDPFYDLPESERRAIRRSEEQGRVEARQLAETARQVKRQAEYDATPEHLRRPENIFTRLIAEWESKSYRPDVAAKIKAYREKEAQREREIGIEMADKLREFEVENNPETKPAREHWQKASAAADTDEERREWARLKGLIDGGAAGTYWQEAQPILERRLTLIGEKIVEHAGRQAPLDEEGRVLNSALEDAGALQVKDETTNEQVTE